MVPDVRTLVFLLALVRGLEFAGADDCTAPLGMQNGQISDQQLSSSSYYSQDSLPKFARLNTTKGLGWCPNQRVKWYSDRDGGPYYDQYFQVTFSQPVRITAIATQGSAKDKQEFLAKFHVNYTLGNSHWKEVINVQSGTLDFESAKETRRNIFKPEVVADTIRVIPSIYPVNQICVRLELYGCKRLDENGLLSYSMPPGNVFGGKYNFSDYSYSGTSGRSVLTGGQGVLTDHVLASDNYADDDGKGWIGWQRGKTSSPYITFTFVQPRVFQSVTFHCNIRTREEVKLFSAVHAKFRLMDSGKDMVVDYVSPDIDSAYGWLSYNVTVNLCGYQAQVLRFDFEYGGEWILLSEVSFITDPVTPDSRPHCLPPTTPPLLETSAFNGTVALVPHSSGLGVGSIVGIVFAGIVLILLCIALLFWWRSHDCSLLRGPKPFSFIHVELNPPDRQASTLHRVSGLSGSDEGKTGTFKNDANACPIYASIGDHLDKGGTPPPSPTPSGLGPVPAPPGKPPPSSPPPDVFYAEPDSPLLLENTESTFEDSKDLRPTPPKDVRYATPGNGPVKMSPDGYAEPVDVIKQADVFRNPVYEEVYADPYQGVSGTSLYADPNDAINSRRRLDSILEFPREKLHFREKIGDGQFGEVHIGEAEGVNAVLGNEFRNCARIVVAIKKLKPEVDKNIKDDFFKEVKIMASLRHENVVRLLGVCKDDPMCMIVEYMTNGDLNQFLKERHVMAASCAKDKLLSVPALLYMAMQLAAGMKYIASLNFVHRDLATRNVLVGHAFTVKIADFGMSRNLYCKHYYRVQGRAVLPVRWMAPECILQGRFTTAGDVWAFGVTLWEILTLARRFPYDLSDEDVIKGIQRLFFNPESADFPYLEQPATCSDDLYQLMKSCWQKEPADRPSFDELHAFLKTTVRHSELSV